MKDFNPKSKYSGLFDSLHEAYLNNKGGEDFSSSISKFAEENDINTLLKLYDRIYNKEYVLKTSTNRIKFDEFFNESILTHVLENEDTPLEYIRLALINLREVSNKNEISASLTKIVSDRYHEESSQFQSSIKQFLLTKMDFTTNKKRMRIYAFESNGYNIAKKLATKQFKTLLKMGYYPTEEEQELFNKIWKVWYFYKTSLIKKVLIIIIGLAALLCILTFMSAILMIIPFLIACYIGAACSKK